MKRKTLLLLIAAALLMGFAACSEENENNERNDDIIWDFSPIEFYCCITDAEGHDLLDSAYQQNLLRDIYVRYDGKDYPVITEKEYYAMRDGTRMYMPFFYGLRLCRITTDISDIPAQYYLSFGEFAGDENIELRTIQLFASDGEPNSLGYGNRLTWNQITGKPIISRNFYLNSKPLYDAYGKDGFYHFIYSEPTGLNYIWHQAVSVEKH
jgi:hypothetical protein